MKSLLERVTFTASLCPKRFSPTTYAHPPKWRGPPLHVPLTDTVPETAMISTWWRGVATIFTLDSVRVSCCCVGL